MRSPSVLLWASALPMAMATCPPTGPVLPPPKLCAPGNLTSSLQQSLQHFVKSSMPFANLSTTSFSVEITSPLSTFFEFHHTAPIKGSGGVEKVDGDTVYRIASISKAVAAYALLLQEGINLDDSITNFVPELSAPGLEIYQDITLRMLMSHTGGAGRDGGAMDIAPNLPPGAAEMLGLPPAEFPPEYPTCDLTLDDRCTRDDLLATLLTAGTTWKPGHKPAYSNLGYSLLGYALENITGLSYNEVVAKYIAEPLGLKATGLELTALEDAIVPVGLGGIWITMPTGIYNATGGLYSTPNDVASIARSILSHTLLSEPTINAWLKPAALTSLPGSAVGAPWEIYLPNNLAHSPRRTEIYTKEGGVPGFGSFMALIPEYNVGITVNVAGDDAQATNRYLLDLVVQDVVPRLEALARSQAETKYAGEYVDADGEGSIVLAVDDGPGLRIASWTRNGVSIIGTWAVFQNADPTVAEARAYPVGEGDRWLLQLDSNMRFPLFEQACDQWMHIAGFRYGGLPADELTFEVDDGRVVGLRVPGTRQRLVKK